MPNDLKNILSNLNKDINQEKLLEYLNSTLSKEEQHSLEMQMNDDPFISDAVDGLQHFEKDQQVSLIVHHLNEGLRKQLEKESTQENIYSTTAMDLLCIDHLAYIDSCCICDN